MNEVITYIGTLSWQFDHNCLAVNLKEKSSNPIIGVEHKHYRMDAGEVKKLFDLCKDRIKLKKTEKKKFTYLTIEVVKDVDNN